MLSNCKSLYLRQHSSDPVNWFSWGEEAFSAARSSRKLIFLSIGYSSCHWCHVMARETFQRQDVADLLNADFVSIKVDREEHPHVDRLYMEYVVGLTGSGGWPLSLFLTPELKPVFGGTYFPPVATESEQLGFLDILQLLSERWKRNQKDMQDIAELAVLQMSSSRKTLFPVRDLAETNKSLKRLLLDTLYDSENGGGFGAGPARFLNPFFLLFLLQDERDQDALGAATVTLDKMLCSGFYDHIEGGFFRYTTDPQMALPHFEKTLYDNALMASVLFSASPKYESFGCDIIDFLIREFKTSCGTFSSSLDAESGGREGGWYLWTLEDLEGSISSKEEIQMLGIRKEGNLPDPALAGLNLPRLAKMRLLSPDLRSLLRQEKSREGKSCPVLDTKSVLGWSALLVSAMCKCPSEKYISQAIDLFGTLLDRHTVSDSGLLLRVSYPEGDTGPGELFLATDADYAAVVGASLDLNQATGDTGYLEIALHLQTQMDRLFWEKESGGYFLTSDEDKSLFKRASCREDGVEPSGTALALSNWARLSRFLMDNNDPHLQNILSSGLSDGNLVSHPLLLANSSLLTRAVKIVLVVLKEEAESAGVLGQEMWELAKSYQRIYPSTCLLSVLMPGKKWKGMENTRLDNLSTYLKDVVRPVAYVCLGGKEKRCLPPVYDPSSLAILLGDLMHGTGQCNEHAVCTSRLL